MEIYYTHESSLGRYLGGRSKEYKASFIQNSSNSENRLTRFVRCTRVQQNFWKRRTKEYLNQLQNRLKCPIPHPNLKENSRSLEWPLARVVEIIPSKVRLVKIKTKTRTYIRNTTKLSFTKRRLIIKLIFAFLNSTFLLVDLFFLYRSVDDSMGEREYV